ncbi:hypothetical protein OAK89_01450 [Akkermansiaceae bacterium]|nr:hypothetical protein [Akkermansiaceae bacterium]MDC0286868.1 hypothetical protein [Akkermansiaceae bacterium]
MADRLFRQSFSALRGHFADSGFSKKCFRVGEVGDCFSGNFGGDRGSA